MPPTLHKGRYLGSGGGEQYAIGSMKEDALIAFGLLAFALSLIIGFYCIFERFFADSCGQGRQESDGPVYDDEDWLFRARQQEETVYGTFTDPTNGQTIRYWVPTRAEWDEFEGFD